MCVTLVATVSATQGWALVAMWIAPYLPRGPVSTMLAHLVAGALSVVLSLVEAGVFKVVVTALFIAAVGTAVGHSITPADRRCVPGSTRILVGAVAFDRPCTDAKPPRRLLGWYFSRSSSTFGAADIARLAHGVVNFAALLSCLHHGLWASAAVAGTFTVLPLSTLHGATPRVCAVMTALSALSASSGLLRVGHVVGPLAMVHMFMDCPNVYPGQKPGYVRDKLDPVDPELPERRKRKVFTPPSIPTGRPGVRDGNGKFEAQPAKKARKKPTSAPSPSPPVPASAPRDNAGPAASPPCHATPGQIQHGFTQGFAAGSLTADSGVLRPSPAAAATVEDYTRVVDSVHTAEQARVQGEHDAVVDRINSAHFATEAELRRERDTTAAELEKCRDTLAALRREHAAELERKLGEQRAAHLIEREKLRRELQGQADAELTRLAGQERAAEHGAIVSALRDELTSVAADHKSAMATLEAQRAIDRADITKLRNQLRDQAARCEELEGSVVLTTLQVAQETVAKRDRAITMLRRALGDAPVDTVRMFEQAASRTTELEEEERLRQRRQATLDSFVSRTAECPPRPAWVDDLARSMVDEDLGAQFRNEVARAAHRAAADSTTRVRDERVKTTASALESTLRTSSTDPNVQLAAVAELASVVTGRHVQAEDLRDPDSARVVAALQAAVKHLLPKSTGGRLTLANRDVLLPALFLMHTLGGVSFSLAKRVLGVNWRLWTTAVAVQCEGGAFVLPARERRKDAIAQEGVLGLTRASAFWEDESRPSEGMKDWVKGSRKKGAVGHVIHWIYMDWGSFYDSYVDTVIEEATEDETVGLSDDAAAELRARCKETMRVGPSGAKVMSRRRFNKLRPYWVKIAHREVCACSRCTQIDLFCAAANSAMQYWRGACAGGCKCSAGNPDIGSGRRLEATVLCAKTGADGCAENHMMYPEPCVNSTCTNCGWGSAFKTRDACMGRPAPRQPAAAAAAAGPQANTGRTVHICPKLMASETTHSVQVWSATKYKTREGKDATKYEFKPEEWTFSKLMSELKSRFPDHLKHKDHERTTNAEVRKLKATVMPHCVVSQQDFAENGGYDPRVEWQSLHWSGSKQYTVFPTVVQFDARTSKPAFFTGGADEKKALLAHLTAINGPDSIPVIKVGVVFVSDCLEHSFDTVRFYNGKLDAWIDANLDCAPTCDCSTAKCGVERNGCACPGGEAPTCTRVHFSVSDGAASQFKNRHLHHWVSSTATVDSERTRVWVIKAPAHGKDDCDPLGGWLKRVVRKANKQTKGDDLFTLETAEQVAEYANKHYPGSGLRATYCKKKSSQAFYDRVVINTTQWPERTEGFKYPHAVAEAAPGYRFKTVYIVTGPTDGSGKAEYPVTRERFCAGCGPCRRRDPLNCTRVSPRIPAARENFLPLQRDTAFTVATRTDVRMGVLAPVASGMSNGCFGLFQIPGEGTFRVGCVQDKPRFVQIATAKVPKQSPGIDVEWMSAGDIDADGMQVFAPSRPSLPDFVPAQWAVVDFGAVPVGADAPVWTEVDGGLRVRVTALSPAPEPTTSSDFDDDSDGDRGASSSVLVTEAAGVPEGDADDLDGDAHREDMVAALATTVCDDEPTEFSALEVFLEDAIEQGDLVASANDRVPEPAAMDTDAGAAVSGPAVVVDSAAEPVPGSDTPAPDGPQHFVVHRFLAVAQSPQGGHARRWLVKWRGYGVAAASWEAETKTATGLLKSLTQDQMVDTVRAFMSDEGQENIRSDLATVGISVSRDSTSADIESMWPLREKCKCKWKSKSARCTVSTSVVDTEGTVADVAGKYGAAPMRVDLAGPAAPVAPAVRSARGRAIVKPRHFGDHDI
jgi:hypothetical protein